MNIGQARRWAKGQLEAIDAANEADELMCALLNCSRESLLMRANSELADEIFLDFEKLVSARLKGMPLQYILGEWEFMGLPIKCEPGVLIPREDTEVLAVVALECAKKNKYTTALDMCCGSGCVGVALAAWGKLRVTCSDINPRAAALTLENAEQNAVSVEVIIGNMFEHIGEKYDMIVSNPPYIPSCDIETLGTSVKDYEPIEALDGGADGLDFYRALTCECAGFLHSGGALFVEIGITQSKAVIELFEQAGFTGIACIDDLNGIPRVVGGYRPR